MDYTNKTIQELNDIFRKNPFGADMKGIRGKVLKTQGIAEKSPDELLDIYQKVTNFNDFTEDNDPYAEHDFGAFKYKGEKIFWKMDYYDRDYKYGSENPADLKETRRVLTIMLANEY